MLRAVSATSASLLQSLDRFCLWGLSGGVPPNARPFLCAASLVALQKPDCMDSALSLRPVAVGETLRRVVAKCALASPAGLEAAGVLRPLQCGVGVPGACELVAQGLQQFVLSHRDEQWVGIQIDLSNAFNCVSRQAILNQVSKRAPGLTAWVETCYGGPSLLFSEGQTLQSSSGAQQGDPLGPLLFSLAWQPVVESLPPYPSTAGTWTMAPSSPSLVRWRDYCRRFVMEHTTWGWL